MLLAAQHPSALVPLCLVEIGERFSFHAMRGIIVLYMVKVFLFTNEHAYAVFATFTALIYFTPLIGGHLADKFIGTSKAVIIGGLLLSAGYFLLAFAGKSNFYVSLAAIVIGSGFFMPNIASCVGQIYEQNNSQRESGFSIFYTALNIGAFLPPFVTTIVIAFCGWNAAFIVSGFGVLFSTYCMFLCLKKFPNVNKQPFLNINNKIKFNFILIIGIVFSIFLSEKLISHQQLTNLILILSGIFVIFYSLKKSFTFSSMERNRLLCCFILTGFSIVFWMMAEQTAMSLAIFTEYNVQRNVCHLVLPTLFFFSLNPFFIITCGPFFSKLWIFLDKRNLNPSIPAKFALGTILMGVGFIILPLAISQKNSLGQICYPWIILSYFLQSTGELLFSPIGLSMMTELSPKRMIGLMIGVWYLATAIAYMLAGYVSMWTALPSGINSPLLTSSVYSHVFGVLGYITAVAGLLILIFVPQFKKLIGKNGESGLIEISEITKPAIVN